MKNSNKKIKIYPIGTKKTDSKMVSWLKSNTPKSIGIARKILVTSAKYLKGGGWFSSKKNRGEQLKSRIYKLEEMLKEDRFKINQFYIENPANILIDYFCLISDAYPNWQNEYKLLTNFIPNKTKYKNYEGEEADTPSEINSDKKVLRNEFGDFIYPNEKGYNKLYNQKKKKYPEKSSNIIFNNSENLYKKDIGNGYSKKRLFLKLIQKDRFEVIGIRTISTGDPVDNKIEDLTREEVIELRDLLDKVYSKTNFVVVVELIHPDYILSPLKIEIIKS